MKLRVFLFATAIAAMVIPVAGADPPVRFPADASDTVVTDVCPFPVDLRVEVNREKVTVFSDGRAHINGTFKVSLSHGDKTLFLNVSGPGFIDPKPDGGATVTFKGRSSIFLVPGQIPGVPPQFIVNAGQIILQQDSSGNITSIEVIGKTTDVCAALA